MKENIELALTVSSSKEAYLKELIPSSILDHTLEEVDVGFCTAPLYVTTFLVQSYDLVSTVKFFLDLVDEIKVAKYKESDYPENNILVSQEFIKRRVTELG